MVNASLTYEILMYLNSFYFGMFAICEIGMGTLKYVNINYSKENIIKEMSVLLAVCIVELIRINLGRRGSLSDHGYHVWLSVVLAIPVSAGVVFLLLGQHFILRLEYILCALMLTLLITELIFAVIFIFSLCKQPTYD